jgi:hypothetical protein
MSETVWEHSWLKTLMIEKLIICVQSTRKLYANAFKLCLIQIVFEWKSQGVNTLWINFMLFISWIVIWKHNTWPTDALLLNMFLITIQSLWTSSQDCIVRKTTHNKSASSGEFMWDLWWTNWHWDMFFSEYFGFPLSISFHRCSISWKKEKELSSSSHGCTISL